MSEYVFRTEEPIEYCYKCPLNGENGKCRLGVETDGYEIPKKCTLIELPPHGRLIDADLLEDCYNDIDSGNGDYKEEAWETAKAIANEPTILEASK